MLETFEVKSDTTDVMYKVTKDGNSYTCECEWAKHHPDFACSCKKSCGGFTQKHHCKHVHKIVVMKILENAFN